MWGRGREVKRLERSGDVAALVALLGETDATSQRKASAALGRLGGPEASAALRRFLADPPLERNDPTDPVTVEALIAATDAVGALEDVEAGEVLVTLLDHAHKEVRRSAAVSLGKLDTAEGPPALRAYAVRDDESILNVMAAVDALVELGAIHQLRQLLEDPNTPKPALSSVRVRLHQLQGGTLTDEEFRR